LLFFRKLACTVSWAKWTMPASDRVFSSMIRFRASGTFRTYSGSQYRETILSAR